jgi:hypothetical protein
MPFATRVFCRESTAPTLTELIAWQRQHGTPIVLDSAHAPADLLSPFWAEATISYDPDEAPFVLRCHHGGDPAGAAQLRAEVSDFLEDLGELPDSAERARVMAHVSGARFVLVVEFPASGVGPRGYETNGWLMSLFVERADGMVQCDGIGFYDENDEIILRLG